MSEETIFSTRKDDKAAADHIKGVIDQDEWDEIIKAVDEQNAQKAAEGEAAADASARAVRSSKSNPMRSKKSILKLRKKVKDENKASSVKAAPQTDNADAKAEKKSAKPKKKGRFRKIFWRVVLAVMAICLCVGIYFGVKVYKIIQAAPEIDPNSIYDMLNQNSTIHYANGETMDFIYTGNSLRTNVEYSEIPKQLQDAFICIEDKTFWDHNGFNYVRIIGAVVDKITGKRDKIGGTSTITQQLARNIFLTGDRNMERKIVEAYYTVLIEKALSKEQILEAYLNTVHLGFNSNGIYAASKAYFNKDISELTLIECAQLAALPQSPSVYAPLKRIEVEKVSDPDSLDIVAVNDQYITYYNDVASDRIKLVLWYMHDQEKISDTEWETAKADSIRDYLNPGPNIGDQQHSSYVNDYITSVVLSDLQTKQGYSYDDAYNLLYNGGLIIDSTIDPAVQKIVEDIYNDENNFPKISLNSLKLDRNKNILTEDRSKIALYSKNNLIDENGSVIITAKEFKWNDDGSLTLLKDEKLNFYNTKSGGNADVRIDIKNMYEVVEGQLYSISDTNLQIAAKYKSRDDAGNTIISAEFFKDYPLMTQEEAYVSGGGVVTEAAFISAEDGSIRLSSNYFSLPDSVIQPQSAFVVIENSTGQIRGMIGGRGIKGKKLFNRATAARQPGSSIKPLTVYSTALQVGYNIISGEGDPVENTGETRGTAIGKVFTAATVLDNIPTNIRSSLWPANFDRTYSGITSLRRAVERSLNGCAVNIYQQLDPKKCIENLQNMGVTSLVLDGRETDENPSSLALGGMTRGISVLEMASAYSTFGNYGVYNEDSCYTTVTNRKGDLIMSADPHPIQVLDESVASLMLDILRTTVTNGLAAGAKLSSQPSAGKTGTTSEQYDLWFCGLTPKYSASVWLGCDTNVSLGSDSSRATKVWKAVMENVGKLDEKGKFELKGDFVTVTVDSKTGLLPAQSEYAEIPEGDLVSEIFIKGTQPTTSDIEARGYVRVCAMTGYLATPFCPGAEKYYIQRPGGQSWEALLASFEFNRNPGYGAKMVDGKVDKSSLLRLIADCGTDRPDFYCPLHNPDTNLYPVSPITRSEYDISGIVNPQGHWETDPETGEQYWVDDSLEDEVITGGGIEPGENGEDAGGEDSGGDD